MLSWSIFQNPNYTLHYFSIGLLPFTKQISVSNYLGCLEIKLYSNTEHVCKNLYKQSCLASIILVTEDRTWTHFQKSESIIMSNDHYRLKKNF